MASSAAAAAAAAAPSKKAKRAKTDPTEKFEEMFDDLYTDNGQWRGRSNISGISDNIRRRHKAFFKRNLSRNPDLQGEFDAYCKRECEVRRERDRKNAESMRAVIDMQKAEADFRAAHKRGMGVKELDGLLGTLRKKYGYYGSADSELSVLSHRVRVGLERLRDIELAFDHCVGQYELAERFAPRHSYEPVSVHTIKCDMDALVSQLDAAGFSVIRNSGPFSSDVHLGLRRK